MPMLTYLAGIEINVYLHLHLHPYFEYASIEGSFECMSLRRSTMRSVTNPHVLIKSMPSKRYTDMIGYLCTEEQHISVETGVVSSDMIFFYKS